VVALATLVGCGTSGSGDSGGLPGPLADYAWAVGDRGTILATDDGGAHWRAQDSGTTHQIGSVAFADTDHGWALANHRGSDGVTSAILITDDGGETWRASESVTTGFGLADVACADKDHVWVVGQSSDGAALILASTDGGATWQRQVVDLPDEIVSTVAADDASHVWASSFQFDPQGPDSRILQSTDGGHHWQVGQNIPLGIVGMAPASSTSCWVVGIPCRPNRNSLALGDADGVSWQQEPKAAWDSWIDGIVRLDESRIGLYGSDAASGSFWVGTGEDADWTSAGFSDGVSPRAVAFVDSTRGWALGDGAGGKNVILTTADGGATWTRLYEGPRTPGLKDVACPSQG
jgi:photosystem II stability/assembly factor-like uncharacterized protein